MLKSSLFILFCKTDADFHQIASFILWLAVYARHTVSFLDLAYSCRTLFYDTFDMTVSAAADPPYCDTYQSPRGNKQQHISN